MLLLNKSRNAKNVFILNKKVLLRERKRYTARRIASTCSAVPIGGCTLSCPGQGVPHPVLPGGGGGLSHPVLTGGG